MIKKWFGWFDIYYAEMLLGIALLVLAVGVLHSFGLDSYSVGEYSNW